MKFYISRKKPYDNWLGSSVNYHNIWIVRKNMKTVSIRNNYAEVLTALGELQKSVDLALQRYIIEQITSKVAELREKDSSFQSKFGCDYPTFVRRVGEDEEFVIRIEKNINKMWETDQAEWEFCHKGAEDWMQRLRSILLSS